MRTVRQTTRHAGIYNVFSHTQLQFMRLFIDISQFELVNIDFIRILNEISIENFEKCVSNQCFVGRLCRCR